MRCCGGIVSESPVKSTTFGSFPYVLGGAYGGLFNASTICPSPVNANDVELAIRLALQRLESALRALGLHPPARNGCPHPSQRHRPTDRALACSGPRRVVCLFGSRPRPQPPSPLPRSHKAVRQRVLARHPCGSSPSSWPTRRFSLGCLRRPYRPQKPADGLSRLTGPAHTERSSLSAA
jgi:hypothetical protein